MEEMCKCGHTKSAHIYEEGACRSGVACSCCKLESINPEKKDGDLIKELQEKNEKLLTALKFYADPACMFDEADSLDFGVRFFLRTEDIESTSYEHQDVCGNKKVYTGIHHGKLARQTLRELGIEL